MQTKIGMLHGEQVPNNYTLGGYVKIKARIRDRLTCTVPSFTKMAEVFRRAHKKMRVAYSENSPEGDMRVCVSEFDDSACLFSVSVLSVTLQVRFFPFLDSDGSLIGQVAIQEVNPFGGRSMTEFLQFAESGTLTAFIENDRYPDEISLADWLPDAILSVAYDVLRSRVQARAEDE